MFGRKPRLLRFRLLFLTLLVLCCLSLMLSQYYKKDIKHCFLKPTKQEQEWLKDGETVLTPQLLEDVLVAEPCPTPGRSIFFHETSCTIMHDVESHIDPIFRLIKPKSLRFNYANLTTREACAVESAALHNPNLDVFVLFASPAYWENGTANPTVNAILSYSNVYLRNLDLWTYASSTPIDKWFKTGELFKSSYVLSHISDFLRYLTLWRWGGTYLDMDVVVIQSLEELPPNYTGAESEDFLAAGVMNFSPDGIGRKVADYCLNDFQHKFNGREWGNNGPGVITRALKHICQTNEISDMFDKERCLGFQVFQRNAFYAIPWFEWRHFFDEKLTESTLKRIEASYVVHVWNKHSKNRKHEIGNRGAYGALAAKHCPKVFATVDEYF